MKKILFIDDGVEFDGLTVKEKPSGGAESSFVSLTEALAKRNHEICVYNNCKNIGIINDVSWNKLSSKIYDEYFDILVLNRGDKFLNFKKNFKKRIFWIHNPAKYLLKYRYLKKLFFNPAHIVFSGKYHLSTFPKWAPCKNRSIIPYGIENFIFESVNSLKLPKPNAIFTSNPERGLEWLLDRWENDIFPKVPNSKLNLFSGLSTYADFGAKKIEKIEPILKRASSLKKKGVNLFNPIKRTELLKFIKKSRLFLYKGSTEETFCMSVAEAQVLGIPTVVKNLGCMEERVINKKTGYVCNNDDEFSLNTIKILKDNKCWLKMHKYMLQNNLHNSWQEIAKMWEKLF